MSWFLVDPLEQFESVLLFNSVFNSTLIRLMAAIFVGILIEKFLIAYFFEINMGVFINYLVSTSLPEQFSYLYYIFFPLFIFVFSANISGLYAYGSTETALIPTVKLLSFFAFFGILFTAVDRKRNYFFNLFLPQGTPEVILKLIIFIEIVSYSTRVVSLGLRLFANMVAGHILLKILMGFLFILLTSEMSFFLYFSFLPWILILAVLSLEILIAFLQSYVFVFLSIVFLKEVV